MATETVMGLAQLSHVPTRPSTTAHGAKYEVADGAIISNEGEKKFIGVHRSSIVVHRSS